MGRRIRVLIVQSPRSNAKRSFKDCHTENQVPTPVLPVVWRCPLRVTFSSMVVWLYGYICTHKDFMEVIQEKTHRAKVAMVTFKASDNDGRESQPLRGGGAEQRGNRKPR